MTDERLQGIASKHALCPGHGAMDYLTCGGCRVRHKIILAALKDAVAEEREQIADLVTSHGLPTGHGDTALDIVREAIAAVRGDVSKLRERPPNILIGDWVLEWFANNQPDCLDEDASDRVNVYTGFSYAKLADLANWIGTHVDAAMAAQGES